MEANNLLNRRDFVRRSGQATLGCLLAGSFPSIVLGAPARTPPNVVFIICDQMRGDALGCLGHPNARTPHLDRMAAEGVLFENYFSNNPVCAPSRVTIFSGLWPHQHGQLTNTSGKPLRSLESTMLGYFRDRGYRVGWVGKNHTYTKRCLASLDMSRIRAREPFRAYSKFVPPYWHSDTLWPEEQCHPRMNTDDGIEFINDARRNEPFFLHLSYFDPHPPYMAPSKYTSRYCSKEMKLPEFVPPENLSDRLAEHCTALHYDRIRDSDLTETMRYYYAAIEWGVDQQVGRIMQALEKKGLIDNTIVMFISDHGDFMGEYRMVRKGMFLYDALLHVPMIWYAPGLIRQGVRVGNLAQGIDIFPTLVDLTGGKMPDAVPGRSLKPFLHGDSRDDPGFAVIASAGYSDLPPNYFDDPEPAYKPDSDIPFHTRVERLTWKNDSKTIMARTREWKLILSETRAAELYKMGDGWNEKENVANKREFAEVRKVLEAKLKSVWKW